ncbi:magnesium transporter MRS2 homolog, mitochondrial-like [Notothenia coriiceps]|uniref:Magnesium transporter MRS2 homolog, mitochondrial-like n=1 Tax=Notothenia coriiceps TaxID=8208 RepID=A0A6I9Q5A5_9TELE|nr:PREDICTED: magnesium transporter MRS2 homolog, mitochondrial-like [Notothenia coriiceps]
MKLHRLLLAGCMNCTRMYLPFGRSFYPNRHLSSVSFLSSRIGGTRTPVLWSARALLYPLKYTVPLGNTKLGLFIRTYSGVGPNAICSQTQWVSTCQLRRSQSAAVRKEKLLQEGGAAWPVSFIRHGGTDVSSVPPAFVVMKFDQEGNVTSFDKKKTELCQELSLQARDLRFQHSTSLTTRNNCIIIRMQLDKALHQRKEELDSWITHS